jgi:glycosyltransferase involved in cell wall biosynthesis
MYKLSYIIPTLNSAKTLEYTILSLRQQELVDVSIIVIDSGSQDETLEICKKWGIDTYYVKPGNMYEAINYGLSMCTTEWVGYLNSDDILYGNSLKKLIELGNNDKADIVYGNCDFIDIDGRFLYSFLSPYPNQLFSIMKKERSSCISQPTAIFRRDLYERLDGFDTRYLYSADYDFFVRAMSSNAVFTCLVSPPVACFRLHENQFSQNKINELWEESKGIISNNLSVVDYLLWLQWKIRNTRHYIMKNLLRA